MRWALLLVTGGVLASAHHAAEPHFDLSKEVVLQATITRFEFVNPHGYVYFTVPNSGGKPTPWRCELPARLALQRLGWTQDVFPSGRKITIKGAPARREENVCMLTSFVREDGREVSRQENISGTNPLAKNAASPRPERLNGVPNLQGLWLAQGGPGGPGPDGKGKGKGKDKGKDKGFKGDFKGKDDFKAKGKGGPGGAVEMTAAGEAASKAYDQRYDDPALKCNPANILFGWTHDQHVNEIVQKKDEIILHYGYMDFTRTIHLNQTDHPKKLTPSTAGHSIGKWEGDVLVVDTVGFQPSVLIPINGTMHSEQMHVVERFSVDAGTLTRTYRVEDPLYLKSPYTGTDVMRISAEPYQKYNCVELSGKNNIRPKQ
jgi:hypothetical protein